MKNLMIYPVLALFLAGCTASGPTYMEATGKDGPVATDQARIVFLRPKNRRDDYFTHAAWIDVNDSKEGELKFGGFFYLDVEPGTTRATTYLKRHKTGRCDIQVQTAPGTTYYFDVTTRQAYANAAAIGGIIGGLLVPADLVSGSIVAALTTDAAKSGAATAVGETVGSTVAVQIEGAGLECGGPFQITHLPLKKANEELADLAWSR